MRKVLFEKKWNRLPDWGVDGDEVINYYIKYVLHFDFKQGLRFSTSVPNYSFCSRNPFKCLFEVLEYSIIDCEQYTMLENRLMRLNLWKKL